VPTQTFPGVFREQDKTPAVKRGLAFLIGETYSIGLSKWIKIPTMTMPTPSHRATKPIMRSPPL